MKCKSPTTDLACVYPRALCAPIMACRHLPKPNAQDWREAAGGSEPGQGGRGHGDREGEQGARAQGLSSSYRSSVDISRAAPRRWPRRCHRLRSFTPLIVRHESRVPTAAQPTPRAQAHAQFPPLLNCSSLYMYGIKPKARALRIARATCL